MAMDRRTYLATVATTAAATAAGCPSAPETGGSPTPSESAGSTTPSATPTGPATRTGRETIRLARHNFPRPFGLEALDTRSEVAAMSRDERVEANRQWVRDHVAAYEDADEASRAFLEPVLGPGSGLRTWYDGADPPAPAPWIRAVTGTLDEDAWIDRQAWLRTFEPGSDAFEYTFGGRRSYDLPSHTVTVAGTEFRGIDPDNYYFTFDDASRAAMARRVLRANDRIWEQMYEMFADYREGKVTHAKAGAFNGAVAIVGGPTMVDATVCTGCGDTAALRVAMNHVNRLALLLEEFAFPPEPLDG